MPLNGEEKMIGEKPPHCPQLGRYDCGTLQLLYFGFDDSGIHDPMFPRRQPSEYFVYSLSAAHPAHAAPQAVTGVKIPSVNFLHRFAENSRKGLQ